MRNIVRCFALAGAAGLAMLCGCTNDEENSSTTTQVDPPSVYMNDPEFLAELDKLRASRAEVEKMYAQLIGELERRVDAMRAAKPGADDATIKEELAKDPEWVSLQKRIVEAQQALEDCRRASTKAVGDRIGRKTISK